MNVEFHNIRTMDNIFNKKFIVAGIVVLFLIVAYLAIFKYEWAVVYIGVLLSGGILIAIAVNSIALCAKKAAEMVEKAKKEANEPKLSKGEFLEYINNCGKVITGAELSELVDKRAKRVDLHSLERLVKEMGYEIMAVCEQCIYFSGKYHEYKLYTKWMRDCQTNYMWVRVKYRVHKEDLNDYLAIANNLTKEMDAVKAFIVPSPNAIGEYRIEIAADTFYSGNERVDNVILSLIHLVQLAEQRMLEMKNEKK